MKTVKKILISILIAVLILSISAVCVGAEGTTEDDVFAPEDVSTGDNSDTTGDKTESSDVGEQNVFAALLESFKAYSGEIMSLLTLVASLILALCYKNGLMPIVKSTLSGLLSAVEKIKENVDAGDERSKNFTSALSTRLESAEQLIDKLSEGVDRATRALDERQRDEDERRDMRVILTAQIDMLYDIFMTSALPQYQKDAVGERISEMKGLLGSGVKKNDA